MIEFNNNTIVYMTAALEGACRQLKRDTPLARAFIANRLEECATAGKTSQRELNDAAQEAVRTANKSSKATKSIRERVATLFHFN
jgi:hypothetical protein